MRVLKLCAVTAITACTPVPQHHEPSRAISMENNLPPMRTFASNNVSLPTRPNSELLNDFLDLTFRLESGRNVPLFTRFEGPISVRLTGSPNSLLVSDLRALISRLQSEAGLDIYLTGAPNASITIEAIPQAELQSTARNVACFVVPRISNWAEYKANRRTPQTDWTTLERRDKAAIFVPADVAPQEIRDCLHEELAQALGPLNDLYRLPDSVFNDDNMHSVLTSFDMLMLRTYYAPELRNGMTRGEVAARLPAILARLNPAGERMTGRPLNATTRDWIEQIETALRSQNNAGQRRNAAENALNLSISHRWNDARHGFANFVFGRLQVGRDDELARAAFTAADRAYRASNETRLQTAHVALQLAAFSLSSGNYIETLARADEAIPIAAAHENAALLATLLMFKAEALDHLGRAEEAQSVRMDSLAWARYGFGSEQNVRARLQEVAALDPR
ncbi:ATP-dependent transcriptional regulator [Marivivens niveibacter]|uniref:ATP-dependent transcriptional regulator n=1 Tax=Marivivens niveibacter TaxID=1930667 RepID=A0A251X3K8_9RHOB|nr:DUF2927 domain-containing protein [Marivivens niveibacter]OUD10743.1 ATP-dependent transcriptional regulator [Marivivens niveibacter]